MTQSGLRAPSQRPRHLSKRTSLQIAIASAVAAGTLVVASAADARTTKIEILSRSIAFGGYSFAGVGQYEKISGIATGEVNPSNPKNSIIVDLALAPRLPNGNVQYRHNFYILNVNSRPYGAIPLAAE